MHVVVDRRRPSIGDALMLGPTILGLREKYNASRVSVLTDKSYMNGALVDAFNMLDGVDEVHTTYANLDRWDVYEDCNDDFLQYEAIHNGNPPWGIAEFWVRHFDLSVSTLRPRLKRYLYRVNPPENRVVGIVLGAGHHARTWFVEQGRSELSRRLTKNGFEVKFIHESSTPRFRDVPRELNKCSVIITPDTSILHLAGALGVPTVSLWGVIDPKKRVEDSTGKRVYETRPLPEVPRGRCQDPNCSCCNLRQNYSCTRSFTVEEIFNATVEMFN